MPRSDKPRLLRRDGALLWSWPDGRQLPVLAGGDDGGEGEGGKEGEGKTATATAEPEGGDGEGSEGERAAAQARHEAKELRKRLRAAEAKVQELENAGKTDLERLTQDNESKAQALSAAEGKVRKLSLRLAVVTSAREAGIIDPILAAKLLDDDAVEYDEDGTPDQDALVEQLRKLAKEHPTLTRGGDTDAGAKGGGGAKPDGKARLNDWLRGTGEAPE